MKIKIIKAYYVILTACTMNLFAIQSAKKLIEELPEYGYGILKNIRNNTDYPVTISSGEKDKILNDELPEGSTIRIKPADSTTGYYALKIQKDGSKTLHYDAKNKGDATTQFRISRYMLYSSKTKKLEDYLILESMDSKNLALGLTEKGTDKGDVELTHSKDFKDKNLDNQNMENHWYLDGTALENCFLRNRKTKGALAPYAGTRKYEISHNVELRTVVGIDATTQLPVIYKAPTTEQSGNTTFWNPIGSPDKGPGQVTSIACKSEDNIWVTTTKKETWQWDGTTWKQISSPKFTQISVTADGKTIWALGEDNKVYARTESAWQAFQNDMKYISVYSSKGGWGIGTATKAEVEAAATQVPEGVRKPDPKEQKTNDGKLFHYGGGTSWNDQKGAEKFVAVSGISAEIAWAVTTSGKVMRRLKGSWQIADTPDKLSAAEIAVRDNDDVWMIDSNNNVWWWNGKDWKQRIGKVKQIALARGTDKIVDRIEAREVNVARTTTPDGKPIKDPSAAVTIEIVNLGTGGNLPQKQTIQLGIPAPKSPLIKGFASTTLENFAPGTTMTLNPLFGKGVAWLDQSLQTPGRCTVTFLARADDRGDIQVVFGTEISEKYRWKIRIGFTSKDTVWSGIFKKDEETGKDVTLYAINEAQNPLAAPLVGNHTPYWVSFDNGFIMVGLGAPGENVFMAHRSDDPTASRINRVGFSCNKQAVEFSNIQFFRPVIVEEPQRMYKETNDSMQAGTTITWSKYPFRSPDRGAVAFTLQGTNSVQVAFGQEASASNDHYVVEINEANTQGNVVNAIAIKKWTTQKKAYTTRAILPISSSPELRFNPSNPVTIWISYQDGMFAIGVGDIGKTPVMVFQDINALFTISYIGFGSSKNPATISTIKITSPANLTIEKKLESYQKGQSWYQFKGSVKIIMPFEYIISQDGPSVTAADNLSGMTFFTGGTQNPGSDYLMLLTINEDGYPELIPEGNFENKKSINLKSAALTAQIESQLILEQTKRDEQEASIKEKIDRAEVEQLRAKAEAQSKTAEIAKSAAGSIGFASGMQLGSAAAAMALSMGAGMVANAFQEEANKLTQEASQKEKGIDRSAEYRKRESEKIPAAAQNRAAFASYLTGAAQFAFKDPNAYVYIDSPVRPALGTGDIPSDAIENGQEVKKLLDKAGAKKPTTQENFKTILSTMQKIIQRCTHVAVINDFVKQKFVLIATGLHDAYQELYAKDLDVTVANEFIGLLLNAINNSYLLDATKDAQTLETFYLWINKLAQSIIKKNNSIKLIPCYGNYVWLPMQPSNSDNFSVTMTIEGRNDAFVCFAKEPIRVRNTLANMYEIVLGGWDNTKHALRIQSLGKSVIEFTGETYERTMLNTQGQQTYTVSFNQGTLSITCAGITMKWTDPYPIEGLRWIGISNWDFPVVFSKFIIQPTSSTQTSTSKSTPKSKSPSTIINKSTTKITNTKSLT